MSNTAVKMFKKEGRLKEMPNRAARQGGREGGGKGVEMKGRSGGKKKRQIFRDAFRSNKLAWAKPRWLKFGALEK